MKYFIGNLKLKNRLLLAPMLEPNDIVFRLLCKKAGCSLSFSGMTSSLTQHDLILEDKPALQIFSNSIKGIKEIIKKYDKKVSLWDFNLGCPSKLSKKLGHGVFLHEDINNIKEILIEIRSSTKKPCTIKLRKSKNSIKIAKLAEKIGFNAIIIHPRTFNQGYSGNPDYNFAKRLKESLKIPVIYSGNVNLKNYKKILNDFDFVMIGREAIGNPNIFSIMLDKKLRIEFKDYLKLAEKYKISYKQIKYQAMNFTKNQENAKKLRKELINAKSIKDIEAISRKFN
ncbi:MAG: tRNA-dihydrouridine synthase family protein [Candidatus Pacearchaeota archaeon]